MRSACDCCHGTVPSFLPSLPLAPHYFAPTFLPPPHPVLARAGTRCGEVPPIQIHPPTFSHARPSFKGPPHHHPILLQHLLATPEPAGNLSPQSHPNAWSSQLSSGMYRGGAGNIQNSLCRSHAASVQPYPNPYLGELARRLDRSKVTGSWLAWQQPINTGGRRGGGSCKWRPS